MFSNFKPINSFVLVEIKKNESQTSSGIIIPTDAREQDQKGTVIHAGNSKQLEAGNVIYYRKYTGTNLDDNFLVLKEEDILGVL